MKNVKRCSISGIAFTMDVDAYERLSAYMDSLRASCGQMPDGDEIVADIEARIAELILSDDSVVELPLVENVIRQMGSPEDISSDSDEAAGPAQNDSSSASDTSAASGAESGAAGDRRDGVKEPRIPRRLYRDMSNAKLGGVCAGLGKYFGADPVWIRLLFVVPLLLTPLNGIVRLGPLFGNMFGMFLLAYIVMWFAVPAARSARQKLEMNGERITAQSIRENTVAGAPTDADSEAKPVVANVVTLFGRVVLILLKILAGIMVFGLIIAACAMIIGVLVLLIGGDGILGGHTYDSVTVATLGISACLVPVLLLIYVLMCLIASRKPGTKTVGAMFVLWIAVIIALIAAAVCEYTEDERMRHGHRHRTVSIGPVTLSADSSDDDADDPKHAAMQAAEVVDIVDVSDDSADGDSAAADDDD